MATKNLIKTFDLFSTPFVFLVGDTKQKRTVIGGLMSFSILVVSIIYCYYLLNMYFNNKVEPKISQSNRVENNFQSISIKENFLIFEMMIAGEPLKKYEKRIGKTFLEYIIYYIKGNSDGSQDYDTFSPVECTDPNFSGYMCMSEAQIMDKDIFIRPIQNEISLYGISILVCDPSIHDNCATDQEIHDILYTGGSFLTVYIKIQQYNPQTLQYEIGYKQEFFYFDPAFYFFSKVHFTKATTSVTKGMIIQMTDVKDTIYDYKRMDSLNSMQFAQEQQYDDLVWIVFEIDQVYIEISVQHPMITEVLAQFMSIFNSLMILGIIARMLAETRIVDDMNNMLLKEYYKKTCATLLTKKEGIKEDGIKKKNKFEIGVSSKQIIDLSKKINTIDIQSIMQLKFHQMIKKQIFKVSLLNRLKIFIFQFFKIKQLNDKKNEKQNENSQFIYKKLLNETTKGINIFELYKDIIQIKMAIKLILSKEQFAALKFCGSEIQTPQDLFNDEISINLIENQRQYAQEDFQKKQKSINSQVLINEVSQYQIPVSPISSHQLCQNIFGSQEIKTLAPLSTFYREKQLCKENESESNQEQQLDQNKLTQPTFMRPSGKRCNKAKNSQVIVVPPQNQGDQEIEMKDFEILDNQNTQINIQNNLNTNEFNKYSIISKSNAQQIDQIDPNFYTKECQKVTDYPTNQKAYPQQTGLIDTITQTKECQKVSDSFIIKEKGHLQQMDLIDESEEEQAFFLERFLQKNLGKKGQDQDNSLNMRILSNLLINDFQQTQESENNNNQVEALEQQSKQEINNINHNNNNNNNNNCNSAIGAIELNIDQNYEVIKDQNKQYYDI